MSASASSVQSVTRRDHSSTRPVMASWAAAKTAAISAAADRTAWAIKGRSASVPATAPGLLAVSAYPTAAAIAVADSCGVTMQNAGLPGLGNSAVR